jgi:hypothetical protein
MASHASHVSFGRSLTSLLSAARDAATGGPGRRTAAFLAESWRGGDTADVAGKVLPRPSLRLAVRVAADEAFRTLMVALAHAPAASELRRIRSEVADAAELFEGEGWLKRPETYHLVPPTLDHPELRKVSLLGSDYHHMIFASDYEPHTGEPGRRRWLGYRPTRTAHAWVMRHHGRPRPWLMCVHGFRMGWPLADFTAFKAAWLHGVLGLNVILPVLPLHGGRKIGRRSGDGFFSAHVLDTIHAEAQAIWDLRRILGWLRSQSDEPIGLYGVSLGAYTSALLSGFEGDLACVLAGLPTICFLSLLQRHAPPNVLRAADDAGLCWQSAERTMRVISPLAFAPRVPRPRRYLFAGVADRLVPEHHAHDLWQHWQQPELRWFQGSHLSFTWDRAINDYVLEVLRDCGLIGERARSARPASRRRQLRRRA